MVHILKLGQVDFPYNWVVTKDASMTLKMESEDTEWMHSLHGAYSESQYIYGEAIRTALTMAQSLGLKEISLMSMGLGLGYVELIVALEGLKSGIKVQIESFEKDPLLETLFKENLKLVINELQESQRISELASPLYPSQSFFKDHFLSFFQKDYDDSNLISASQNLLKDHHLDLKGEISLETLVDLPSKYNLILYDAFSSNTQSSLWSDEFLHELIGNHSDLKLCVFTTYAKVGALNRALKTNSFEILSKKGFAFKRESTLATRNLKSTDVDVNTL